MALPKSKYSSPRHTPGKEFTLSGNNYIGWYVVTYKNEYYTGKEYTSQSKKLTPIEEPVQANLPLFIQQSTAPDTASRKNGIWKRYFVQKNASLAIIEVNRERFSQFKSTPGYKTGTLNWKIKGPAEDVSTGGYTYFGAIHVNKLNTKSLESQLKGITSYIKDYAEFVE